MTRREKSRDTRDYDTTQLREAGHGRSLHRDYSAHFWRWSFARRFIGPDDVVLDVGCGQDRPLSKILTGGAAARVLKYVGVDLNKLKPSDSQRLTFLGEFNLVEDYQQLGEHLPEGKEGFDVLVHLEVIEHMHVDIGRQFLETCHACLRPGGTMLMSTPCYDGKRHAANHIHEYTVPELRAAVEAAGFVVERRFGTFMDLRHVKKAQEAGYDAEAAAAIESVYDALSEYYDNDALSCFFAPLFPDQARNNLWVCRRPVED